MIFRKIDRKSSFGDPIGLNHLVSENIGSGGHFGVFTTQIANFFTKFGSAEVAIQITKKYEKSGWNFAESAECSKSSGKKLKVFGNNLFLLFNSIFDVVYGKTQYYQL